jgi:hypothetical protein
MSRRRVAWFSLLDGNLVDKNGIEWINLALGSFMAGWYEYEMNSGVQPDFERNHRRAFCLTKKRGKSVEVEWHATEREMLKFRAVRYRGSYSSVRMAHCH